MDTRSTEHLNRILKKGLSELNDYDKRFLNARQTYLTEEQKMKYMDILGIRGTEQPKVELSYTDLLSKAKSLGYSGPRISKEKLQQYIDLNTERIVK